MNFKLAMFGVWYETVKDASGASEEAIRATLTPDQTKSLDEYLEALKEPLERKDPMPDIAKDERY